MDFDAGRSAGFIVLVFVMMAIFVPLVFYGFVLLVLRAVEAVTRG